MTAEHFSVQSHGEPTAAGRHPPIHRMDRARAKLGKAVVVQFRNHDHGSNGRSALGSESKECAGVAKEATELTNEMSIDSGAARPSNIG